MLLGAGLAVFFPHILEKQYGSVFAEVLACVGKGECVCLVLDLEIVTSMNDSSDLKISAF